MSDTDELLRPVLQGVIERGPKGRFTKGNPGPPERAKRKKGQLNKVTRTIKDALTGAAAKIGFDGEGKGGVDGFLERVGRDNPEFLAMAVVRSCVPPAKEPEPVAIGPIHIEILPVMSGWYVDPRDESRLICEETVRRLGESSTRPIALLEHRLGEAVTDGRAVEVHYPARPAEPVPEVVREPEPEPDDGGVFVVRSAALQARFRR